MKKIAFLIVLALMLTFSLSACSRPYKYMTDGKDYKNVAVEAECISPEKVLVTFSAEIFIRGGTLSAYVDLLSEGSVVGSDIISLTRRSDETVWSISQEIPLEYYNYGEITVHVSSVVGLYQ